MILKREIREAWVEENLSVKNWLSRIGEGTRRRYRDSAYKYFRWLWENGVEFAEKTPAELLDLQEKSFGRESFRQLELLQRWVNMQPGRRNSKNNMYTAIRSFYAHNRVPLPRDITYRVRSDKEPVNGQLDVDDLKKIVLAANRRYRAVLLCMFQGFMGEGEFEYFNKSWDRIGPQLEQRKKRVKIWFPGRKHARNERPFYSFIGRDAIEALKEYLKVEREPIRKDEAIFLNDQLEPVSKRNIRRAFHAYAEKTGVIKKPTPACPKCGSETVRKRRRPGPRGKNRKVFAVYTCTNPECGIDTPITSEYYLPKTIRYGVSPHEMRDLARSEWELSPAKSVAAEFFMGHDIDPNMYNKIMKLHPEWAEEQYALAEPFLNILSEDPRKVPLNKVQQLEEKVEELEKKNLELKQRLNGTTLTGDQVQELLRRIEKLEKQAQKQT